MVQQICHRKKKNNTNEVYTWDSIIESKPRQNIVIFGTRYTRQNGRSPLFLPTSTSYINEAYTTEDNTVTSLLY